MDNKEDEMLLLIAECNIISPSITGNDLWQEKSGIRHGVTRCEIADVRSVSWNVDEGKGIQGRFIKSPTVEQDLGPRLGGFRYICSYIIIFVPSVSTKLGYIRSYLSTGFYLQIFGGSRDVFFL